MSLLITQFEERLNIRLDKIEDRLTYIEQIIEPIIKKTVSKADKQKQYNTNRRLVYSKGKEVLNKEKQQAKEQHDDWKSFDSKHQLNTSTDDEPDIETAIEVNIPKHDVKSLLYKIRANKENKQ